MRAYHDNCCFSWENEHLKINSPVSINRQKQVKMVEITETYRVDQGPVWIGQSHDAAHLVCNEAFHVVERVINSVVLKPFALDFVLICIASASVSYRLGSHWRTSWRLLWIYIRHLYSLLFKMIGLFQLDSAPHRFRASLDLSQVFTNLIVLVQTLASSLW